MRRFHCFSSRPAVFEDAAGTPARGHSTWFTRSCIAARASPTIACPAAFAKRLYRSRSEEHTSELQSLRHLVYLPSFPTRRSSDLLAVTQHGSPDPASPPAHRPPSPAQPLSRSDCTGPWRAPPIAASHQPVGPERREGR